MLEDGVSWGERSLWFSEHKGWQGSCKTFSIFCPLFSCASLSSGLFIVSSKVCLALGLPEPSQIRRDRLSRLLFFEIYNFLKFTWMFTCYVSSFHHLEGVSGRFFFSPRSHLTGWYGWCFCFVLCFFKSLLLLAEEHGRAIEVYIQTSWN